VDDIRNKVKYNDSIAGILILSPDNPTGVVWPREILDQIVEIAQEHDLFLIADEIYAHIVYPGQPHIHMSQWVQDVPPSPCAAISKEYPWPGARCGWVEILNRGKDENLPPSPIPYSRPSGLRCGSTTLPQMSIPRGLRRRALSAHLARRAKMFSDRADQAVAAFDGCDAVVVNKPGGAFYLTVMFKDGVLNSRQTLPIADSAVRARIDELVKDVRDDKRFVYYLMAQPA